MEEAVASTLEMEFIHRTAGGTKVLLVEERLERDVCMISSRQATP